jgi:archaellum component FlaC
MNSEDFNRLEQIVVNFKEDVKAEFRHQIGIQSEHFQHKLDIVIEGHEVLRKEIRDTREELCEKIKFVDFKVEVLNQKIDGVHDDLSQKIDGVRDDLSRKIDAVAADLKAHRTDTEVHKKVYKVKED